MNIKLMVNDCPVKLSDETVAELKKVLIAVDPMIKLGDTVWDKGQNVPLTLIRIGPTKYQLLRSGTSTWNWDNIYYENYYENGDYCQRGVPLSVINKTHNVEYRG